MASRHATRAAILAVLTGAAAGPATHAQPYTLNWWTVDGGGALNATGGTYTLSGTAGQPDASAVLSGGSYTLAGGFWPGSGILDADVSVTLSDSPDPVTGLQVLTYTISVNNLGPASATSLTVVQTLPPSGATFQSATGSGWSCLPDSPAPGQVRCTRPSLAAGATAPAIAVQVGTGPQGGTLTSTVTVTGQEADPVSPNNADAENTAWTGVPYADLALSLSDGGITALWMRPITYTITVTNPGPSAVTGAMVADAFSASLTGVGWTCVGAGGSTCAPSGTGAINSPASVTVGGSVSYTATGTVVYGTAGPIPNTASVASPIHDPDTVNNSRTVNTPVNADLIFGDGFQGS
jgi:uncharacterized repeat protein (TIGR01451 family)